MLIRPVKVGSWYKTGAGAYIKILGHHKDEAGDYFSSNNTYCYDEKGNVLDEYDYKNKLNLICEVKIVRSKNIITFLEKAVEVE